MEVQSRDRRTGAHNFTCLLNALHDTQLYSTSALIVATFDRAETGEGQWTGTPALKCEANSIGCNHLKGRDSDRRASGLRVGLTRERCSSSKLHSATCERLQNLWCYFQKYLLTVAMQSTQTCWWWGGGLAGQETQNSSAGTCDIFSEAIVCFI